MSNIPFIGYSDKLSGRPGEAIAFKVSSELDEPYYASLVRVICADPNPAGPGIQLDELDFCFGGPFESRAQPFFPGSHAIVEVKEHLQNLGELTISTKIWPTTPLKENQVVFCCGDKSETPILSLGLDCGFITAYTRSPTGGVIKLACDGVPLKSRQWYHIWASFDPTSGTLSVGGRPLSASGTNFECSLKTESSSKIEGIQTIVFAASDGNPGTAHFNGKIEQPELIDLATEKFNVYDYETRDHSGTWCLWDFAIDMSSTRVKDVGPLSLHGTLLNMPARAMTGSKWTGEEMCWKHAPKQYGAIHFHDDDIYDFCWDTDFTFKIPEHLKSGLYAVRIRCGKYQDMMPFYVCPPRGKTTAALCVLASTFTYIIYGNHARPNYQSSWLERIDNWNAYPWNPAVHQEYGLSTYNFHSDGSGICHASNKRPLFSLRPGYITFGETEENCSGLRHLQADTHLYALVRKNGYPLRHNYRSGIA